MAEAGRRELEEFIETGSGLLCSSTFVASEVYRAMELGVVLDSGRLVRQAISKDFAKERKIAHGVSHQAKLFKRHSSASRSAIPLSFHEDILRWRRGGNGRVHYL